MKNFLKAALLCLLPAAAASAQEAEEQPIITIHSSAYTEVGESNQFSFLIGTTEPAYFDVDLGAGKNEVEFQVVTIDTTTGAYNGTWVPARADANGVIKIYGDASLVDVIVMDGAYVTDIDMEQCTNLVILSLEHNALQRLDLTPFTKLEAVYLTDNPFTAATPLVVGTPKPNLSILEVDIIDHMDSSFNLSDYPNIAVFDAYHNFGIKSIDPTGCPQLRSLSLEMTAVDRVDVSKNPLLSSLNVSESRVTELDLSANPNLVYLMADHASGTINTDIKLDHIDLTNNPALFFLSMSHNNLTEIDLSKNPKLQNLALRGNKFKSIDLSANSSLYSVDVMLNDMDYATLPLPQSTWGEYYYNQNSMPVNRVLAVGQELDMSDRVLREGSTTTAKVMRKPFTGDAVELDNSLYTYENGKITFNEAVSDSVYVQYSNDVFSDYDLTTSMFRVKNADEVDLPSKMIALSADYSVRKLTMNLGVAGASQTEPKTVLLDFGTDEKTSVTTCSATIDDLSKVTVDLPDNFSGKINVWTPEGNLLTAFGIDGVTLYNVDLQSATSLQQLSLTNADLYTIDLRYNRNLTDLDLSGNQLSTLSLNGIYGDYEKNKIRTLKAANNRLTTLEFRDGSSIRELDFSGNKFTTFPTTAFEHLSSLNLSNNELAGELSLTYQVNTADINVSNNPITSLKLDTFTDLQHFDISNTGLTLETLPLPSTVAGEYVYAPLNKIALQAKAPAVNLTAQNRVIDGVGTTFVWKKADGTILEQGVDIDCVDGGTRFLNEELGNIYCEMTNPAFPGLTLQTTEVTVVGAPTKVVATLTASSSATGSMILRGSTDSALYVDWRGDGTEYEAYPYSASGVNKYAITPVAGATAKIYTYDEASDITVFSIYDVPMTQADFSPLTGLTSLAVSGAGLTADNLTMPEAKLTELNLSNNKLTSFPYAAKYPNLYMLNLSGNEMTTFDASIVPTVAFLYLANNKLTSVKFNNPEIYDLHINGNALETVDLTGLTGLRQLFLQDNNLESIDLQPVKSTLRALNIVGNRFTFATLPRTEEAPQLTTMYYALQAPLSVECVNGRVDLSSQAMVDETATTYVWYLGEATLDSETGEYVGEALIEGEEYTVENGVTSFLSTFSEKVMCIMSNDVFPNLLLTTDRVAVDCSGIDEIHADSADNAASTGCYDLQGRRVENPAHGIYIINGRKVFIR